MPPFTVHTLAECPELRRDLPRLHAAAWPRFMFENATAVRYWFELESRFADWQIAFCTPAKALIAVGYTIPIQWDGTLDDLPAGWDDAIERGLHSLAANTLVALVALIEPSFQGQHLGPALLRAMLAAATARNWRNLIAPVRPSLKCHYPLTPIDRYAAWMNPQHLPFDPWLRAHVRLGAQQLSVAPVSRKIRASITQWETWSGLSFPESGHYIVPGALTPIEIIHPQAGVYLEPNIWVRHRIGP